MAEQLIDLKPVVHEAHRRNTHAMHHDAEAAARALAERDAELKHERERVNLRHATSYTIGRMLIAVLFVVSAIVKLSHFSETARGMADLGLADTEILLGAGIAIELVGGALLFIGLLTRAVSVALIAYLACVTVLVLHDFAAGFNGTFALANVAFAGSLLMLYGHGGGAFSLERWLAQRRNRRFAL